MRQHAQRRRRVAPGQAVLPAPRRPVDGRSDHQLPQHPALIAEITCSTYLSELESSERGPILKITKELKGEVNTEGFSVDATSQHESSAESTPGADRSGRVVVYGKVARVFKEEHTPCREGVACGVYTEFAAREVWKHPIEEASNCLIEHPSHNCRSLALEETNGRECFLAELEHETEPSAPGAVIVPIAILK